MEDGNWQDPLFTCMCWIVFYFSAYKFHFIIDENNNNNNFPVMTTIIKMFSEAHRQHFRYLAYRLHLQKVLLNVWHLKKMFPIVSVGKLIKYVALKSHWKENFSIVEYF